MDPVIQSQATLETNERKYIDGIGVYQIGGVNYASVTSILAATKSEESKLALQRWRDKVGEDEAERISKAACERGTAVHSCCEALLRGEVEPEIDEIARPFWLNMQPHVLKLKPDYIETFTYYPELKYAGRFDVFGTYDGQPNTIVDFKTASKPTRMEWIDDYWLQVAAYAGAIEQTLGVATDRAVIITVTATTAQEFSIDRTQLDKHWERWQIRVEQFWSQHSALAN